MKEKKLLWPLLVTLIVFLVVGSFTFSYRLRSYVTPLFLTDEIHFTFIDAYAVTFNWHGRADTISYGVHSSKEQIVKAHAPSSMPLSTPGPFWEAALTGLLPDTVYRYTIGGGAEHTFRTPPLSQADTSFVVVAEGDIGDAVNYPHMAKVQSFVAALHPAFSLMLGDLTYANRFGPQSINEHFNDVMVWSQDIPYMPAWGNHEWANGDNLQNYKGRFDLPHAETSPPSSDMENQGAGEDWYWFDYGSARFINYPEPSRGATPAWRDAMLRDDGPMAEAQKDPNIRYIVTFGHRPVYSSGLHRGEPQLVKSMQTLGEKYSKFLLNVNGHSHDYERSIPMFGVTHITAGTGGADLEAKSGSCIWKKCPAPSWSAVRYMRQGLMKFTFTREALIGEFICGPESKAKNDITCNEGDIIDTFTLYPKP